MVRQAVFGVHAFAVKSPRPLTSTPEDSAWPPSSQHAKTDRINAPNCQNVRRTGWRMPWALRMRIAELLLRCIFESSESVERTEESDALVGVSCWPG